MMDIMGYYWFLCEDDGHGTRASSVPQSNCTTDISHRTPSLAYVLIDVWPPRSWYQMSVSVTVHLVFH